MQSACLSSKQLLFRWVRHQYSKIPPGEQAVRACPPNSLMPTRLSEPGCPKPVHAKLSDPASGHVNAFFPSDKPKGCGQANDEQQDAGGGFDARDARRPVQHVGHAERM